MEETSHVMGELPMPFQVRAGIKRNTAPATADVRSVRAPVRVCERTTSTWAGSAHVARLLQRCLIQSVLCFADSRVHCARSGSTSPRTGAKDESTDYHPARLMPSRNWPSLENPSQWHSGALTACATLLGMTCCEALCGWRGSVLYSNSAVSSAQRRGALLTLYMLRIL